MSIDGLAIIALVSRSILILAPVRLRREITLKPLEIHLLIMARYEEHPIPVMSFTWVLVCQMTSLDSRLAYLSHITLLYSLSECFLRFIMIG
jgi:hypothetical protein